jgi:hypothetical protein
MTFSKLSLPVLGLLIGVSHPIAAHAKALDDQFDCSTSPHDFISALIEDHSIGSAPTRVEMNSVNVYKAASDSGLTAFGFRVSAVFGYEPGSDMFKPGRGDPIAGSIYGAVLAAPYDAVVSRLHDSNASAAAQSVIPMLVTAVVCKKP